MTKLTLYTIINKTKNIFFITAIFLTGTLFGQIRFEEGYYIDNLDNKTTCLIKNIDWKNNPTEFEYKLSSDSEAKIATINHVKEFGFNSLAKYLRATVGLDTSKIDAHGVSNDKSPILTSQTLFLKVLIEGKSSLYKYENKSLKLFFYSIDSSKIEQLIFKKYYFKNARGYNENKILENNSFRNQLWVALKCSTISKSQLENLKYYRTDLKQVFSKYNSCTNSKNIDYDNKYNKNLFNLSLRPGLNNSSFNLKELSSSVSRKIDFGYQSALRLGIELEAILPFNKNKWGLIFEPVYQSYKSEADQVDLLDGDASVYYSSLEVNVGLRHYFFISDNAKIFVNGGYVFDKILDSKVELRNDRNLLFEPIGGPTIGIGLNYNDNYSIEFRYLTNRDFLWKAGKEYDSSYQTFSFIFGYTIF